MEDNKIFWLTRRLNEIGKTKIELAAELGISPARLSDIEKGVWRFQAAHIRKAAEFLQFDRTALLDFVSGDITEKELWDAKAPEQISKEDLALLKAVKSIATREAAPENTQNISQPSKIQEKDRTR